MATTTYTVNSAEAVKLWSKKLAREALKATWFGKFIGDNSDSICQLFDDTQKGAGDRITIVLRMQLSGDGVSGDGTLEGNEEALTTYTDNAFIDQLRHAVRSQGKMTQQRVTFSIREEAMMGLKDWWAGRFDQSFFNQVCGNTAQTDLRYTGMQTAVAPDTNHVYRPNSRANDQSLTTGDEMTLQLLDQILAIAKLGGVAGTGPVIRPVKVDGEDRYVVILHTNQVTQLRTNTATGQWLDIQKAAMTGDGSKANPIMTGALGMYNGMVLHESTRIPLGVNSSTGVAVANTRRAVLLGAQSACLAFGKGYSFEGFDWNEELFDYGNQLGVEAGNIFGIKKLRFNSADFGTVVLGTYTA
jgi:N4-gp56 family major capsid protein